MIQRALSHYHLLTLTSVGLLLFIAIFTGALVWVFRRGSSQVYGGLELLPLRELEPEQHLTGDKECSHG